MQMNYQSPNSSNQQQQIQQSSQNTAQQSHKQININGQYGQNGKQQKQNLPVELPELDYYVEHDKQYPFDANNSRFEKMITCPSCNKQGITKIRGELGATAILISCISYTLTFLFCFWQPLCGPFRMYDKIHNCSNCGAEVGIWPYAPCQFT